MTSTTRSPLIIGNWKMNASLGGSMVLLQALAHYKSSKACELAVCVPFPYLAQTQEVLAGSLVSWGAQDVSDQPQGAYTGEVSAAMLHDFA